MPGIRPAILSRIFFSSSLLSNHMKLNIYRTTILSVLYGRETRFRSLRVEHRLRVLEDRVLRGTLGPKGDAVTGERKLHSEELHDLYC